MSWILFSILAALAWAVVNTVDKYVLTKWVKKPIVPVMILGVVGLIASILVYLIHGFSELSFFNIFLAIVAGTFSILMSLFYFKAVKIEEISRIVPLFYLSPLFVLILAAIFLGEIFTPMKYVGIVSLVVGAIMISLKKTEFKISVGKAFWLMILSTLVLSINLIIAKYLLNFADFWTVFAYIRIGGFIAVIPIFYFNFHELRSTTKEYGKKVIITISLNEVLNLIGTLLFVIALSIGYVTLVSALSSIQPFFVLLFVILLTIFYPKILKEEIGKSTLLLKFIAILLMFVGVILIT